MPRCLAARTRANGDGRRRTSVLVRSGQEPPPSIVGATRVRYNDCVTVPAALPRDPAGRLSPLRLALALPWIGLACAAVALLAGASWPRLRVLTAELGASAVAVAATMSIERAKRRRAWRQRQSELPRGVPLQAPLWVRLDMGAIAVIIGGLVAAVPAAFGLSAVSVGVFLTFAALAFGMPLLSGDETPRALSFEDEGLRVLYRKRSGLITWESIRQVRQVGPDSFSAVMLEIADRNELMLMPWTGGLDGAVLAHAIEQGRRRGAPVLN